MTGTIEKDAWEKVCSLWPEAFKPRLYLAEDAIEAEDEAPERRWTYGFIKSFSRL